MSVEQLQQILSVAPAGPDFANEPHVARKAFDGMLASLPVPEDITVAESSLGGVPVVRATVPESKIVETLVEMALEMAEEMGVDPESGEATPVVTVS